MKTAFADFIIMSVWFRLKLFSKCSFDLELHSVYENENDERPDDLDDVAEEEDVDEDDDDGGDGEEVDAVALVHPAKLVFICHSEHKNMTCKVIKYRQKNMLLIT